MFEIIRISHISKHYSVPCKLIAEVEKKPISLLKCDNLKLYHAEIKNDLIELVFKNTDMAY